jgi:hypothetical protein
MRLSTVLCLVVLLLAPAIASAGLITNGGFETGDFTGWTQFGNTGATGVGSGGHSGSYQGDFGAVGSMGGISQTLATTPGASYVADFWLANDGGTPNEFQFIWDGSTVQDLVNSGSFGWTHYVYGVTASTASTTVAFSFRQDPAWWHFDDADVNSAVPEPATIGLVAAALLGLGLLRRKTA